MKVTRNTRTWALESADGDRLTLVYDNRGDPYRQGASIRLHEADAHGDREISVFLETQELRLFRAKLNELLCSR